MSATDDGGLLVGADGKPRCWWCGDDPLYVDYHDREWGRPVGDDRRLYEKLCLEGFQAGLSWITILRKRAAFREAFADFDVQRVARFTKRDVARLLRDERIVRHRGKIESAINNAQRVLEVVEESGSFASLIWSHRPSPEERPARIDRLALGAMTSTPSSVALSRDLRRRGFTFIGPTTAYAFMQAMGLVNDHVEGCASRAGLSDQPRRPRTKD